MSASILFSRREALRTITGAAVGVIAAGAQISRGATSAVHWVPGLQLYTLGLTPKDDLAASFAAVAAIGYREVELPGHYDHTASDLRRLFDNAHLSCPAVHFAPRPIGGMWDLTGDLSRNVADLKTLGASRAVVPIPFMPDRIYNILQHPPAGFDEAAAGKLFASLTADDWKRAADLLNEKGAIFAKAGVRLAHHNHGLDFVPLPGGTCGYRMLVELTDPRLVDFELDIGWAVSAGQDLPSLFKLSGERIRLLHLKDTKRRGKHAHDLASTDIGTGIVKWNEVVDLVRHNRIEHMFVEQETPFATTPIDAAKVDYRFLTKLFSGGAA
jgi:sugar phosphate isomerase/epimerase